MTYIYYDSVPRLNYTRMKPDDKSLLIKLVGLCELCGTTDGLVVDHCHQTNAVRGILCGGCNLRVGWVEAIKLSWMQRAADYLGNAEREVQLFRLVRKEYERKNSDWIGELQALDKTRAKLMDEISKVQRRVAELELRLQDGGTE